ncbi:protein-L-isoaspartate O-methyltransferase [Marinobacterium nitratireducens]|uniref:Protein-L-isoaspartate O-methyltransferase n=2 Tax=Marinobacterium nitratireducens TaxID=518897 RepID=A0A918DWB6_9GAMM|nr:protein-L-isoaspartate O-methyltransferase [Marinobacterium nitratireducens]
MSDVNLQGIGMTSRRTRERLTARLREQGIGNEAVLEAIRDTPRHIFIDEALSHRAYEDTSLPIGFNQTISQPFIVARMTELLLEDGPCERVLEVGTGSGYQTAILAALTGHVYSLERIRPLQEKARKRMSLLKFHNVQMRHSDGFLGWPAQAPFDGILVAAAPESVPDDLLQQLAIGGRLVIPVGGSHGQELKRIRRLGDDEFETEVLQTVKFVPLVGGVVR